MTNDPGTLTTAVTEFAAGHSMTIVPAIPGTGSGHAVVLDADDMELPDFLELAGKMGDGALYLRTETFGQDPDTGQPEDVPANLAHRRGQTCELRLAFASAGHGLLHFWEQTAPWYQEWLDSPEGGRLDDVAEDLWIRQEEEDRSRQKDEIAEAILADQEFRGAAPGPRRRRAYLLSQQVKPEGMNRWVGREGAQQAMDRIEDLTDKAYQPIWNHLDDLAADFLASPAWQQAASAAARKQATEQFLITRVEGFYPPPVVRDELYARTQRLSKSSCSSGLF